MINIQKQIEYWKNISLNDIDTANVLFSANKNIEGMFFCHLCIEKILKAHVVKSTQNIPPKTHDLFHLASIAKIELSEVNTDFCQILMKYQLEGRYPEFYPKPPSNEKTKEYFNNTKTLQEWLIITL